METKHEIYYDFEKTKPVTDLRFDLDGYAIIKTGIWYVYGQESVFALGDAAVYAYDNAQLIAIGNSQVYMYDNSWVQAYQNAKIIDRTVKVGELSMKFTLNQS